VQQRELLRGQLDLPAGEADGTGARVDGQLAHPEQPLPAPPLRPPQHRPHAPEELGVEERLRHEVVGAAGEAAHPIGLAGAAAQHDHGQVGIDPRRQPVRRAHAV
jgi:hypothetical protein